MKTKIATERDKATRNATAFRSWDALMNAHRVDGYFPTLNRENAQQVALGALIEAAGVPVYWIGKGARHAA